MVLGAFKMGTRVALNKHGGSVTGWFRFLFGTILILGAQAQPRTGRTKGGLFSLLQYLDEPQHCFVAWEMSFMLDWVQGPGLGQTGALPGARCRTAHRVGLTVGLGYTIGSYF